MSANIPVLATQLKIEKDPVLNLMNAIYYLDPAVCNLNCAHCPSKLVENPFKFFNSNQFIQRTILLSLMGAQCVSFEGGEPTMFVKFMTRVLPFVSEHFPVIMRINGTHMKSIEAYVKYVDGFRLDIKIPLKKTFSKNEKVFYNSMIGQKGNIFNYRNAVLKSIKVVDGMPLTYYTMSNFHFFEKSDQDFMLKMFSELESPFYIESHKEKM